MKKIWIHITKGIVIFAIIAVVVTLFPTLSTETNSNISDIIIQYDTNKNEMLSSLESSLALPSTWDWRSANYKGKTGDWTTPIRNQGECSSCWAFAAVGTLESVINIREGNPDWDMDLSEQYVLSCLPAAADTYGEGCLGGNVNDAFYCIKSTTSSGNGVNGIIPESCMPYLVSDDISCSYKCSDWMNHLVPIADFGEEDYTNYQIRDMLYTSGPVATIMEVYSDFYDYDNGIYEKSYGNYVFNHAVIIVGYNNDQGYWICKNSWGTSWGENGWFKIYYDECDIGNVICWVDYAPTTVTPILSYNPHSYDFGIICQDETESTTFQIWNGGIGTLSYTISESCDWIGLSTTSGSSTGEQDTINVNVDTENLEPGFYEYDILIDSNEGSGLFTVSIQVVNAGSEEIDQIQDIYNNNFKLYKGIWRAQSFTPSLSLLKSIDLYIAKSGIPVNDLECSIRDAISGLDIVSISKSSTSISSGFSWINFDFSDIELDPGELYYIVLKAEGGNSQNCYRWGYGYNNPYDYGSFWYTSNYGSDWFEFALYDYCFKTCSASINPSTPILDITPSSHSFGTLAQGITDSTTFEIWNGGDGTLSYSLSESCNWLNVVPYSESSTGEHDVITINIDTSGLDPNEYQCDITISSNGGTDVFKVYLTVFTSTEPSLSFSPKTIDFGEMNEGQTKSKTLEIWNSGTGSLSYNIIEDTQYLDINPTSGISTGEHDYITVTLDATGLSNGIHQWNLDINSNGGNDFFTITVDIVEPTPILSYNPTTYNFGTKLIGQTDSTTFEIWNGGEGILSYDIDESCSWLSISTDTGQSTGEHDTIIVYIDTTYLNEGSYEYDISLSSNGGNTEFIVYVTVISEGDEQLDQMQISYNNKFNIYKGLWKAQSFIPALQVLTSVELYVGSIGSPPNDLVLSVRSNLFGSNLAVVSVTIGSISESLGWIRFDFSDIDVISGQTYYLVLNSEGGSSQNCYVWGYGYSDPYPFGSYWYSGNYGSNWFEYALFDFCFKSYGISLGPTDPILSYAPTVYNFGTILQDETASTSFEIWNSGIETLTYSISEPCNWLNVIPGSGSSTGEHDGIDVNIDTSGLNPGGYQCDVVISSNGGSGIFTIYINVEEIIEPMLSYNPRFLDFGDVAQGYTSSKILEIWNGGSGTLTYSITEYCNWLTISPTGGSSIGEHDYINAYIDTNGLDIGEYSYTMDINSNAGSVSCNVFLNVVEGGDEQIDQMQILNDNTFYLYRGIWRAQSFTPTLLNLAYVDVYVGSFGNPLDDLVLSIRSDLYGPDLVFSSVSSSSILHSLNWVRFDFTDLDVVPGETYYIILKTDSGSSQDHYIWSYSYSDPYDFGTYWYTFNTGGSWWQYSPYDLCFITYGY